MVAQSKQLDWTSARVLTDRREEDAARNLIQAHADCPPMVARTLLELWTQAERSARVGAVIVTRENFGPIRLKHQNAGYRQAMTEERRRLELAIREVLGLEEETGAEAVRVLQALVGAHRLLGRLG